MAHAGMEKVSAGATPAKETGEETETEALLSPSGLSQPSAIVSEIVSGVAEGVVEVAIEDATGMSAAQLGRLREVLVAVHPEAVPELIAGGTFEELLDSVAGARAAFTRARDEAARTLAAGVPRGGGKREIDPAVFAGLSPEGKIAVGLQRK